MVRATVTVVRKRVAPAYDVLHSEAGSVGVSPVSHLCYSPPGLAVTMQLCAFQLSRSSSMVDTGSVAVRGVLRPPGARSLAIRDSYCDGGREAPSATGARTRVSGQVWQRFVVSSSCPTDSRLPSRTIVLSKQYPPISMKPAARRAGEWRGVLVMGRGHHLNLAECRQMTTDGGYGSTQSGVDHSDGDPSQPGVVLYGPALPEPYGPLPRMEMTAADDEPVTQVVHRPGVLRGAIRTRDNEQGGWSRQPFGSAPSASTALALAPPSALARLPEQSPASEEGKAGWAKGPSLWRIKALGWGAVAFLTAIMYVIWFGVPVVVQRSLGLPASWVRSQAAPPAPEGVMAVRAAVGRPLVQAAAPKRGAEEESAVTANDGGGSASEPLPRQPERTHVLAAVESVRAEARACGFSGTTFVNVTVEGRTGRVTNAAADRALGDVSQCIARAVRRADFPRFEEREFRIKLMLRL